MSIFFLLFKTRWMGRLLFLDTLWRYSLPRGVLGLNVRVWFQFLTVFCHCSSSTADSVSSGRHCSISGHQRSTRCKVEMEIKWSKAKWPSWKMTVVQPTCSVEVEKCGLTAFKPKLDHELWTKVRPAPALSYMQMNSFVWFPKTQVAMQTALL